MVQEIRRRTRRDFRFYPRRLWIIGVQEKLVSIVKKIVRRTDEGGTTYRDLQSLTMTAPLDCSQAKALLGWTPVSDRETFFAEAINGNLKPFKPGDLRLGPEVVAA